MYQRSDDTPLSEAPDAPQVALVRCPGGIQEANRPRTGHPLAPRPHLEDQRVIGGLVLRVGVEDEWRDPEGARVEGGDHQPGEAVLVDRDGNEHLRGRHHLAAPLKGPPRVRVVVSLECRLE